MFKKIPLKKIGLVFSLLACTLIFAGAMTHVKTIEQARLEYQNAVANEIRASVAATTASLFRCEKEKELAAVALRDLGNGKLKATPTDAANWTTKKQATCPFLLPVQN